MSETRRQEAGGRWQEPALRTPGMRLVCMDCGCDLPGGDPAGKVLGHGLCRTHFEERMAGVFAAQDGRAA
jgi:hypothetical protein